MIELLAGVLVALAAVGLVLEPLVRGRRAPDVIDDEDVFDHEESESPKVRALLALREIEFDREMGKLSDGDYGVLRERYARVALDELDREEALAALEQAATVHVDEDLAEMAVRRARSRVGRPCSVCGPRPEPNAVFCSDCGRTLDDDASSPRCWQCGTALPNGANFCAECGLSIRV